MSDEKSEVFPTWGYSKDDAKIFDLKEGESLPEGYYVHPSKIPDEPKPADKPEKPVLKLPADKA